MLALAACSAAPALAAGLGGGNSFNELTGAQPETTTTDTTSTAPGEAHTSSSNSTTLILIVGAAAIVLLVGIALVIARDARRVAPAGDAQLSEARSARDTAARVRRRRAQAKAARRQRKRNR